MPAFKLPLSFDAYARRSGSILGLCVIAVSLLATTRVCAQGSASAADSLVQVVVKDGQTIVGKIVTDEPNAVTIETSSGLIVRIPRDQIVSMEWVKPRRDDLLWRNDPNYSRLLFAPTGRPLRRGGGYFSNHYILLAGLAGGLTDQISVLVGASLIPAVSISDQLLYIAPKIGYQFNEDFAASVGTLFFNAGGASGGVLWAVATFGKVEASVTTGLGFGYLKESDDDAWEFSNDPIVLVGGTLRLSNSSALVSENWLVTSAELSEVPFTLAVRFFGDRLAADFGFIFVGDIISEGLPVPWLSMTYNWGTR